MLLRWRASRAQLAIITRSYIHLHTDAIERAFAPLGLMPVSVSEDQEADLESKEGRHESGNSQGKAKLQSSANAWCERGDSNPHGFTRQILSLVRLPIPPLSQPSHCGLQKL